ncbi:GOLPH3/VPS74 family protein [Mycolicibacterium thermoresistibile]
MAKIAEELFLLLLDNGSAQPALDKPRRTRVLTAAVLLDLAYACRIRPAVPGDPAPAGQLLALSDAAPTAEPLDPVTEPVLRALQKRPLRPARALSTLGRRTERNLADHLERTGQIRRIRVPAKRFRREYAWPLTNRDRVGRARAEVLAVLFEDQVPAPSTAAIISLLHAVDGLGALLSLNDRGWRWVHAQATEIATGTWGDDAPMAVPEMNLVVTTASVRPALM